MKAERTPKATRRNLQVLQFMTTFLATEDRLPSAQNISDNFGWASPNAATTHLKKLLAVGLLERRQSHYRIKR